MKTGCFVLEGLNALATSYYFNYLFFFMRDQFGFGNAGNFLITALHGFVYLFAAWLGGRFAQCHGYFFALRIGFFIMTLALSVGGALAYFFQNAQTGLLGQFVVIVFWTIGMCFTWPSLQALVSENETPRTLPRRIGIYNMVWAGSTGVAFFTGGALLEKCGAQIIFWLPVTIHLFQLAAVSKLKKLAANTNQSADAASTVAQTVDSANHRPIAKAKIFLLLAWTANPFAYVAINSLLPAIPKLAATLELSSMYAGFVCSVWFFARLAAFIALWFWTGWHYRFRFLLVAYVAMASCFGIILLIQNLWILIFGQIIFGLALGLIYYSSIFYSMDVGETKGEHGGIHEAMIGAGVFAGPALGVTALHFFPGANHSGILAVTGLLGCGLLVLIWLYVKKMPDFKVANIVQRGT